MMANNLSTLKHFNPYLNVNEFTKAQHNISRQLTRTIRYPSIGNRDLYVFPFFFFLFSSLVIRAIRDQRELLANKGLQDRSIRSTVLITALVGAKGQLFLWSDG